MGQNDCDNLQGKGFLTCLPSTFFWVLTMIFQTNLPGQDYIAFSKEHTWS